MKKALILFLVIFVPSAFGQTLHIGLSGVLQHSATKNEIFRSQFLFPADQSLEIFTGPYTIRFSAEKMAQGGYNITAEFFGLGPDYHNAIYNLEIPMADSIPVLPLPVKDGDSIKYTVALLDDTSSISTAEPLTSDTTAWGTSVTIHYQTHWLKGSYADFLWNVKMGYLEDVYNRYRSSFKLSEFDKIDYYLHPTPQTAAYLNPKTDYAIQPKARRIDLVFGADIDVASPRLAAELLLYRMWGYAPRWMVTGFAGYYDDNFLQMRKLADSFKPSELAAKFADESWVDSDTGRIVTGAFSRWLADSRIFSKFMELYRQSTALNFQSKFRDIYNESFERAAAKFLEFAKSYKPKEDELEYYASEYMGHGNYKRARDYLLEACKMPDSESKPWHQLILSEYWLGDYKSAAGIKPDSSAFNCDEAILKMNISMADGIFDPLTTYKTHPEEILRCGQAIMVLSMHYLDRGDIESAQKAMDRIYENDKNSIEYFIALGRLKVMQGRPADSILTMAAAIALNRAQTQPQEPVNYYLAGQAFLLMNNYDKAKENLDISNFLENRPYFRGLTLLELGKLADLQGQRDEAKDYYQKVLNIKAGAYEKSLAEKYLKEKYEL